MGLDEFEMETDRIEAKRIRQRNAFREEWERVFALRPDDAIIDHILDVIERA